MCKGAKNETNEGREKKKAKKKSTKPKQQEVEGTRERGGLAVEKALQRRLPEGSSRSSGSRGQPEGG